MVRLRRSATVGLAGSAKPGAAFDWSPDLPSPPVRRSSVVPSYVFLMMVPFTNEGSSLMSGLAWHAASARSSGRMRLIKEEPPDRVGQFVERLHTPVNVRE